MNTHSLSYQVLMCIIDTTYSKSQYQSQFLRPKWVSVSTFETKVKSLGLSLNLWDYSKSLSLSLDSWYQQPNFQSWLLIPSTKNLSLKVKNWSRIPLFCSAITNNAQNILSNVDFIFISIVIKRNFKVIDYRKTVSIG